MKRFFFHTSDGVLTIDDEGTELPSVDDARLHASRLSGDLLSDDPASVWSTGTWRVEVTDDAGQLCFTLVTVAVDAIAKHPSKVG